MSDGEFFILVVLCVAVYVIISLNPSVDDIRRLVREELESHNTNSGRDRKERE